MRILHLTLLASFISCCSAAPLDNWVHYSRPANTGPLHAVTYGNGLFVAVGAEGTIITSMDGANWAAQDSGVTYALEGVKFVNEQFFAFPAVIGDNFAPALVSSDGVAWTPIASLVDICYGKGTYVAVRPSDTSYEDALHGTICTSTDLVNWEDAFAGINQTVEFGNNIFLAASGDPSYSYQSEDGISWTQGALVSKVPWPSITFANGQFFVSGYLDYERSVVFPPYVIQIDAWLLSTTANGTEWVYSKELPITSTPGHSRLAAGGGYYVLGGDGALYYASDIASDWTVVNLPEVAGDDTLPEEISFGAGVFVAVSKGNLFRSGPVTGGFALVIHTQPVPASAIPGSDVELFVGVQGSDPMSFQWRKDGTPISGATNQLLLLSDVDFDSAGEYDVIVTNPEGSVTSEKATLTIHFAEVRTYAGITLRGSPGDQFRLEYQNALDSSGQWHELSQITLTESMQIWIDYDSPDVAKRFYRATFLGN